VAREAFETADGEVGRGVAVGWSEDSDYEVQRSDYEVVEEILDVEERTLKLEVETLNRQGVRPLGEQRRRGLARFRAQLLVREHALLPGGSVDSDSDPDSDQATVVS
jgi:hypothetical protein